MKKKTTEKRQPAPTKRARPSRASAFSHFDERGRARMVDVSEKPVTSREAIARGTVRMRAETLDRILKGEIEKGDVFTVARVAAILAAKRAFDWIPMCHPLEITGTEVAFDPRPDGTASRIEIEARVRTRGRTGVEMEALAAVAAAGLTVYDMCKAVDREMVIGEIRLMRKSGGRSGTFVRREPQRP